MNTESMTLQSTVDADVWASNFGLETADQEANISAYIWNNKPFIGCTYAEFQEANPEFDALFWSIAEGD